VIGPADAWSRVEQGFRKIGSAVGAVKERAMEAQLLSAVFICGK
jgi:hypothetical protein